MAISCSTQSGIAWVTLGNRRAGNALDDRQAAALHDTCRRIIEDDAVRVAVFTGAGAVFCSPPPGIRARPAAEAIAAIVKPTIAALNGDATGPGLELALACDIRLAARGSRLAMDQVTRGEMPSDGGTQRLPRLIARSYAADMLLTGRRLTAAEAQRIGLVTEVTAAAQLQARTRALAQALAAMAPIAARYVKEAIREGMETTLAQGLRLEADLAVLLHTTKDRAEGISSFLERREPRFTGS
ncbi:MAG: hypothetical protein EXR49_04285 [Dehalococcoidia bacterium]|nr:hypothetical protein [Dehalococcoidia bacterium]